MYTPTKLNPGEKYVIKESDKAYILFQDNGEFDFLNKEKIETSYAQ